MTDASGTLIYSYEINNRLLNIKKSDQVQIDYAYDDIGNIDTITDKKGFVTTYKYDKASRMETVTYTVSGASKTTTYAYDANGNRESITYSSGINVSYTYDKNNRLKTLINYKPSGVAISSYAYDYDLTGRQKLKTDKYGDTVYDYDGAGRVCKVSAPGKTSVYTYDDAGNRLTLNETYESEQSSGYTDETTKTEVKYKIKSSQYVYSDTNALMMLVESMKNSTGQEVVKKTISYKYDNNGNQLSQQTSFTKAYTPVNEESFGIIVAGATVSNTTDKTTEVTTNQFDGFNRLKKVEATKSGVKTITEFVYNGDDLRVKKTVKKSSNNYASVVTNYYYDRQHVILETDNSDNVKSRYIKGINYIARLDAANKHSYFMYNGHGDVIQTVSEAGEIENSYDYDIWGNLTLNIQQYDCAIKYAGEFYDSETGLYYLRARYYDPYTGRFISEDSYWGEDNNPLSLNLYTYCHNDPIQFVDPSGHYEWGKGHVLKEGNESTDVKDLQVMLIELGFLSKEQWSSKSNRNVSSADGIFGPNTAEAVKNYKIDINPYDELYEGSNVGDTTWMYLERDYGIHMAKKYSGGQECAQRVAEANAIYNERHNSLFTPKTTKKQADPNPNKVDDSKKNNDTQVSTTNDNQTRVQYIETQKNTVAQTQIAQGIIIDKKMREDKSVDKIVLGSKELEHGSLLLMTNQIYNKGQRRLEVLEEELNEYSKLYSETGNEVYLKFLEDLYVEYIAKIEVYGDLGFEIENFEFVKDDDYYKTMYNMYYREGNFGRWLLSEENLEVLFAEATNQIRSSFELGQIGLFKNYNLKMAESSPYSNVSEGKFTKFNYKDFEKSIFYKGTAKTWTVDTSMYAADEAAGVLKNGSYIKNPTAQNINGLIKEGSNYVGNSKFNGQYMYVVDTEGNIIIGNRAGQRMPHPTLVGGANPKVQSAGMVEIRGGKIYKVDNASGHFKPGDGSLDAAQNAFSKLPTNVFSKDFQGYVPYGK